MEVNSVSACVGCGSGSTTWMGILKFSPGLMVRRLPCRFRWKQIRQTLGLARKNWLRNCNRLRLCEKARAGQPPIFTNPAIYQSRQRGSQFLRLETERPRFGFVCDAARGIDRVETIRPTRVGLLGRVAEFVDDCGNLYAKFSHTRARHQSTLFFIFRAGKNNFVLYIAFHLPNVARMRFRDVHHQEGNFVSELLIQLVKSGNLPPEWRSSVAAKDQHHRLPSRRQAG